MGSHRYRWAAGTSGLVALAIVACSTSYGGGAESTTADAGAVTEAALGPRADVETTTSNDGAATDLDAPAPVRCDGTKPFGAPIRVPGLPVGAACARFSPDESLVIYSFDSELRTAQKVGDAYGPATKVAVQDDKARCGAFSADRTFLFHEENFRIWEQSGPAGGPYAAKTAVPSSPAFYIQAPYYDETRSLLWVNYHLEQAFFGAYAIGVAEVHGGAVDTFRRVDVGFGVDSGSVDGKPDGGLVEDGTPVISMDGSELFFSSIRTAPGTAGSQDVWVAHRSTTGTDFDTPSVIAGVDSGAADIPTWVSPDACRLYFHSTRLTPDGGFTVVAMYVTERQR